LAVINMRKVINEFEGTISAVPRPLERRCGDCRGKLGEQGRIKTMTDSEMIKLLEDAQIGAAGMSVVDAANKVCEEFKTRLKFHECGDEMCLVCGFCKLHEPEAVHD
jgi:NADH:ubiquinone oxidoreductase subunit F (NADH-binding)